MATALFVLFWVLLALTIVFVAMRSGQRVSIFNPQTRGGRRMLAVFTLAMLAIFGVGLPVAAGIDAGEQEEKGPSGIELTAAEANGREKFARNCAQCHTLDAAAAVGQVGPNLDELRPPASLVLDAVKNGRARGQGQMPALLVEGEDAKDVAAYVAKVAGH